MNNLLAQNVLGYSVSTIPSISLNWIGQLIRVLIEGIGIVGVGIIVFTLILKCVVLPLDIYSRVQGKKQALIMERMRPQMEKLQQQYANDKTMYNQKVVELQRKSGYSMLGSCLPMIVSLVIFIFVWQAFAAYSQYANLESYNDLVNAYNGVVETYVIEDADSAEDYGFLYALDEDGNRINKKDVNVASAADLAEVEVSDYEVDFAKFAKHYNNAKSLTLSEDEVFVQLANDYKKVHTGYDGAFSAEIVKSDENGYLSDTACAIRVTLVNFYLEEPAAQAARDYYLENNNSFLWVRNLWYPDSMFNKEMPNFADFKKSVAKANISDDYSQSYEKVTSALGDRKSAYNGYFVLIVMSIGFMLLQQFISMRSNKAVNDLSTVDGTGARTNKMMMIMMPLIYGVFAFTYSASFSVYMITNTLFSLATMLLINKLVDIWFKKMDAAGKLDEILNKKAKKREAKAKMRAAAYASRSNKRK